MELNFFMEAELRSVFSCYGCLGNRRWPNVVGFSHRVASFDTAFRRDGSGT
jgi:hypothetical protein